jgi:Na+-transporting NADH:ubiquinone oxidoreductase subunit B
MAAIRQFLDGIEHHFEKGGKYERWYALYEAVDTIFYTPASVTSTTSHVRDGIDLKRIMIIVWLCSFPGIFSVCGISAFRPTVFWRSLRTP